MSVSNDDFSLLVTKIVVNLIHKKSRIVKSECDVSMGVRYVTNKKGVDT